MAMASAQLAGLPKEKRAMIGMHAWRSSKNSATSTEAAMGITTIPLSLSAAARTVISKYM
jgi:hypothetical protein